MGANHCLVSRAVTLLDLELSSSKRLKTLLRAVVRRKEEEFIVWLPPCMTKF